MPQSRTRPTTASAPCCAACRGQLQASHRRIEPTPPHVRPTVSDTSSSNYRNPQRGWAAKHFSMLLQCSVVSLQEVSGSATASSFTHPDGLPCLTRSASLPCCLKWHVSCSSQGLPLMLQALGSPLGVPHPNSLPQQSSAAHDCPYSRCKSLQSAAAQPPTVLAFLQDAACQTSTLKEPKHGVYQPMVCSLPASCCSPLKPRAHSQSIPPRQEPTGSCCYSGEEWLAHLSLRCMLLHC